MTRRVLEIDWASHERAVLPHRYLRQHCRCAACLTVVRSGREISIDVGITIVDVTPYGPSALQLSFSDGHATGLYPFAYLRDLAALVPAALPDVV